MRRRVEDRILTIKGHLIEAHVSEIARRFGTIGLWGEDGVESLHPAYTKCGMMTVCIPTRSAAPQIDDDPPPTQGTDSNDGDKETAGLGSNGTGGKLAL